MILNRGDIVKIKSADKIKSWQLKIFGYVVYKTHYINKIAGKEFEIFTFDNIDKYGSIEIDGVEYEIFLDDVEEILTQY